MTALLAQEAVTELSRKGFVWGMVIVAMLAAGWIIIAIARKRSAAQSNIPPLLPFTLHDLRKLHEEGQLTDEEFERARSKIVSMSKAHFEDDAAADGKAKVKTAGVSSGRSNIPESRKAVGERDKE